MRAIIKRYSAPMSLLHPVFKMQVWEETINYFRKQLIGDLWYLYNSGGYVCGCYGTDQIKFID